MAKNNRGGQKGRSGPPGNLNAARSILPVIRRLQKGKPLPENLARVAAISDREAEQLIADKGGLENMTGGEQAMLQVWKTARQTTLLILHELVERGAVVEKDGCWDLAPGVQRLAGFLGQERAALLALGLDSRGKNITDIVAEIAKAENQL